MLSEEMVRHIRSQLVVIEEVAGENVLKDNSEINKRVVVIVQAVAATLDYVLEEAELPL